MSVRAEPFEISDPMMRVLETHGDEVPFYFYTTDVVDDLADAGHEFSVEQVSRSLKWLCAVSDNALVRPTRHAWMLLRPTSTYWDHYRGLPGNHERGLRNGG